MSEHDDPKRLNRETQQIWDANARFWDARFGEGNNFQRLLIGPATERLLALRPGELVLDAACGNGAFSRRMAELGAQVVAFDFSEQFLELARARTAERPDLAGRIEYHQIDATDRAQLLALGSGRFDAAVCTMAVMDMAEIDPLLSAASQLLKPGGRFVFSVTHPCFSTTTMRKVVEEEDRGGELVTTYAVKISRYITPTTAKGLGMIGQPVPQLYFDRPLSLILGACFAAGFVLDGLEEPVFPEGAEANRPFSWENFQEIPPVRSRISEEGENDR
jgi:2-polyprenyl-3-methyl-5-hydroxy-6-metoxy-1,4-benzoquinol methylase